MGVELTQALESAEDLGGWEDVGVEESNTHRDTYPSSKRIRSLWAGGETSGQGGARVLRP